MDDREQAGKFLGGEQFKFKDVDELWKRLQQQDHISLARAVLSHIRGADGKYLLDGLPDDDAVLDKLCQQEAMLTSKDPELGATTRHQKALEILRLRFGNLSRTKYDGDAETLGIAGGIHRRRWEDLGQQDDLRTAAEYYRRGALGSLGEDGYAHVNAALMLDLLASMGDDPEKRREVASKLRHQILDGIPADTTSWFAVASRADSLVGLGRYAEAAETIKKAHRPEPWKLETTTRQMVRLVRLREANPLQVPGIADLFNALLPGGGDALGSAFIGKVGLALSGGGFRASFYHLGVLARLAELDVLRHIEVLSCVSGGSIVGACYWLSLRRAMMDSPHLSHADYLQLVQKLIDHFVKAVGNNMRRGIQPNRAAIAFRMLFQNQQGALEPEKSAEALDEFFYRPLYAGQGAIPNHIFMHELPFTPKDHDPALTGSKDFNPTRHNWLRANKVPALVINATTVNTGRGWQFTPTWMGESPWALNEGADNIERLQWAWYDPAVKWQISLARAVAASASVPGVFAPLKLDPTYKDIELQLVDGGVFDNQGIVSLLAMNCNVLLVSDAAGQLMLEPKPTPGLKGLASYAGRAMDVLMERIRQANYADLSARRLSGLIRGLMFLHMKAGLDADTIRLPFSQESFQIERSALSPSGVRKDFQKALAELRTDLDAFTEIESTALMACGYQMASKTFEKELAPRIPELTGKETTLQWPFDDMLGEITSTASTTTRRPDYLKELQEGSKLDV